MSKDKPKNPKNPVKDKGSYRVLRGGGWNSYPGSVRLSGRFNRYPYTRGSNNGGFRIVKNTPKEKKDE